MKKKLILCLLFLLCLFSFRTTHAKNSSIEVTNISIVDKSGDVLVSTPSFSDDEINANITFNKLNDSVTFELDLKNVGKEDFFVEKIEDNNKNDNISIEYSHDKKIDKDSTSKIQAKILYKKQLINQEEININDFEIIITLSSNGVPDSIIINPQTGDSISIYIVIFAVSLVILLFVSRKIFKDSNIVTIMAFMFALIVPSVVFANQQIELRIRFDSLIVKGEFEKHNIVFDLNNGEDNVVVEGLYSKKIGSLPEKPKKKGYNFIKWVDEEGNEVTENTIIKKDMVIKAEYSPIKYSISYDLDGGTVDNNPSEYTIETNSFTLNNPTKEGYTFAGWTGSNGDSLQTSVTIPKGSVGDKTYKANYSKKPAVKYTVYHMYQNVDLTSYTEEVQELEGVVDTVVKPETRDRIGFISPSLLELTIKEDGTNEIVYRYKREKYNLTIKNGDEELYNSEIIYQSQLPEIEDPVKEGHTFNGWDSVVPELMPANDVILNAIWSINKYTINYDTDGGSEIASVTQDYNTEIEVPSNPTKEGHTFVRWEPSIPETMPAGGITVKAIWSVNKYTINYDTDGGSEIASVIQDYNTEIEVPSNPTREGHTFVRWEPSIPDTMPVGGITVKAIWSVNKYTINYDTDGGSDIASVTQDYNTEIEVPSNPTKEGHTFVRWEPSIPETMPVGGITVKAIWSVNQYTVSFDSQGGSDVDSITDDYDSELGELPTPIRPTYTFDGWYTKAEGGDKITSTTLIKKNVTYYAHWTEILMICRKATTLHTAECTNGGCQGAGYTLAGSKGTTTITYGKIASSTRTVGDAYDCDVNGDGIYDADKERFYYLNDKENKAVLIYYSAFEVTDAEHFGPKYEHIFPYISDTEVTAVDNLPTTDMWNHTKTSFNGKAARFITKQEVISNCSSNSTGTSTGSLDKCEFLFEGSRFESTTTGRTAYWIERENGETCERIFTTTRIVEQKECDSSKNAARPVVEIPIVNMDEYIVVKLNANGGSVTPNAIRVNVGGKISSLPTPTREKYLFDGWYTAKTGGTEVNLNEAIEEDKEYFARWSGSLALANIENSDLSIIPGESISINITNQSEIDEEYTFESSDESIATVDSDGVITAVADGTTVITIEGVSSHAQKTINVTVDSSLNSYTITVNTNGGTAVDSYTVERNHAIGTLPTTTRGDHTFVDWYSDSDFTNKVTPSTIVSNNMTIYAKWRPNNAIAEVNGTYYDTVSKVFNFNSIPTDTKINIKLYKNISTSSTINISSSRTVELDMNGYTINYTGTSQAISNSGKLEILNGTIMSGADNGMINNNSSGELTIKSGTYQATGSRQVVYNNGGTATILGGTLTSSSDVRATVHNLNNGTIYVYGGTIISTGEPQTDNDNSPNGIRNQAGKVYIGNKDEEVNTSVPTIQGNKYGVRGTNVYFHNGIVKGKTNSFSNMPTGSFIREGMSLQDGTDGDYKTSFLS